jgi:uncharacterized OB-fold protein
MAMPDRMLTSPHQQYVEFCQRGQLAYQVDGESGQAVFYPRLVSPFSGSTDLAWKVSAGRGTVHATTVVYERGVPSHNVCLVDLDEGYRMMASVQDMPPLEVVIGMRVAVRFAPGDGEQAPYPVFVPMGAPHGGA